MINQAENDAYLCQVFLTPIQKCALYQPAFGQAKAGGLNLKTFQKLYGEDPFYAWLGLDAPAVYAAHKAAGGLTSVYRQIGVGSERLFKAILTLSLELSSEQMEWHYAYSKPDGKTGVHTLDACIKYADLNPEALRRFNSWMKVAQNLVGGSSSDKISPKGIVFEVRQGYKSADSKRQNADLRYGVRAYQAGLLPAFAIMSSQVSEPVLKRYRNDGLLVLTGILDNDPTISTFAFFEHVVGYDLAGFFTRNAVLLSNEVKQIVEKLLIP